MIRRNPTAKENNVSEEVINDLLGYDGIKIIQRPDMFNFSLDSRFIEDFNFKLLSLIRCKYNKKEVLLIWKMLRI